MPLDATNLYPKGPVKSGDIKQFYDLATGVMLDQPVTYRNVLSVGGNQGLTTVPLKIYGQTGQNTNLIDLYPDRSSPQPGFGFSAIGSFAWGPGGAAPQDTFLSRIATQADGVDRPGLLINPDLRVTGSITAVTNITMPTSSAIILGSATRIRGDFSNALHAQRALFITTTANSATIVGAIPNGTAQVGQYNVYNNSNADAAGTGVGQFGVNASQVYLNTTHQGAGSDLPLVMNVGATAKLSIPTAGYATLTGLSMCIPNSSYYAAMDTGGVQRPMLWSDSLNNTAIQAAQANVIRFLNQPASVEWARFDANHFQVGYQESIVYLPPGISASSYSTAMLELRTNASVPPQIGFHMPGAVGAAMYMPTGGWPRWITNSNTDYAFVMDGLSQTLSGKTLNSPVLSSPSVANGTRLTYNDANGAHPALFNMANGNDYQVDMGQTVAIGTPGSGTYPNYAFNFNHAFTVQPMVLATIMFYSDPTRCHQMFIGIHGIGTNGFQIDVVNQTGGSQTIIVGWIAIGR